ncbi:MAG: hypothetical protein H6679_02270 [Epsilonproteobacteria bacterium]|nr:hypothetical protein [Campylobacterota bacterium]
MKNKTLKILFSVCLLFSQTMQRVDGRTQKEIIEDIKKWQKKLTSLKEELEEAKGEKTKSKTPKQESDKDEKKEDKTKKGISDNRITTGDPVVPDHAEFFFRRHNYLRSFTPLKNAPHGAIWTLGDKFHGDLNILVKANENAEWKEVDGGLRNLAVHPDKGVWGINKNGNIYFREGITQGEPGGKTWRQVSGGLHNLVFENDQLYGTHANNKFYKSETNDPTDPKWKEIKPQDNQDLYDKMRFYNPAQTQYHKSWKLPDVGRGALQFTVKKPYNPGLNYPADIMVSFSIKPQDLPHHMYHLTIGGWNNTRFTIRRENRHDGEAPHYCWIFKDQNPAAMIADKDEEHYWIAVNNGIISMGKADTLDENGNIEVGVNEILRWQDQEMFRKDQNFDFRKATKVGYFGFSGWEHHDIEYKNIKVFPFEEKPTPVSLHKKFHQLKEPDFFEHKYHAHKQGQQIVSFRQEWKLPEKNRGAVTFKARAHWRDIYVLFTEKYKDDLFTLGEKEEREHLHNFYFHANKNINHLMFLFGGWNNSKTRLSGTNCNDDQAYWIHAHQNPLAMVKVNTEELYWVMIDNGVMSFGKIDEEKIGSENYDKKLTDLIGKNPLGTWRNATPVKNIEYVGFSGYEAVDFTDIRIYALKEEEKIAEKEASDTLE